MLLIYLNRSNQLSLHETCLDLMSLFALSPALREGFPVGALQMTFQCSGGVTIKSSTFEARAERLTVRNGKMLFSGKVSISMNQAKTKTVGKAVPVTAKPAAPRKVRFRNNNFEILEPGESTKSK